MKYAFAAAAIAIMVIPLFGNCRKASTPVLTKQDTVLIHDTQYVKLARTDNYLGQLKYEYAGGGGSEIDTARISIKYYSNDSTVFIFENPFMAIYHGSYLSVNGSDNFQLELKGPDSLLVSWQGPLMSLSTKLYVYKGNKQ